MQNFILIYKLGSRWIPLTPPSSYALNVMAKKKVEGNYKPHHKLHIVSSSVNLATYVRN